MKGHWITVALTGAALLVGTVLAPTVVQAATAGLVRIEGGGSTHVATVNTAGQLSVTDGTQHSRAGQLKVVTSDPGKAVVQFLSSLTCSAGGSYTAPPGKALIITGLTFYNIPTGGTPDAQEVLVGPAATPCSGSLVAAGLGPGTNTTLPQTFDPGIPVPAGYAVGGHEVDDHGSVSLYGYLVPAADVPPATISRQPHGTLRRLSIVHH